MEGQPTYKVGGYKLSFFLVACNSSCLQIDATQGQGLECSAVVESSSIPELTHHCCETAEHLFNLLILAAKGEERWSMQAIARHSSLFDWILATPKVLDLVVTLKDETSFTISLDPKCVGSDSRFPTLNDFKLRICHEYVDILKEGWVMKKSGGRPLHATASPGLRYTKGKHYMECRIISLQINGFLVGVQESINLNLNWPGLGQELSGKCLYGNGHYYHDGSSTWYDMPCFSGEGDRVGVLLDMDNKQVSWSINGRMGEAKPLSGKAYCFIFGLYSGGDMIEIIPEACYHK